jgi:hypothetical protein
MGTEQTTPASAFWAAIREGRSYQAAEAAQLRVENQALREAAACGKEETPMGTDTTAKSASDELIERLEKARAEVRALRAENSRELVRYDVAYAEVVAERDSARRERDAAMTVRDETRARPSVLEAGETRAEWGVQARDARIYSYGEHEDATREYLSSTLVEGDRLVRREVRTSPWVPVEDEAAELAGRDGGITHG